MTDPLRLLDSTDDEVVRAVLRSAGSDEAPSDTPAKVAAAVGIALPALAIAAVSKTAFAASGAGGAGTCFGALGAASATKLAAVSVVVASGVALGLVGIAGRLERGAVPPGGGSALGVVDSARAPGAAEALAPGREGAAASALPAPRRELPGGPGRVAAASHQVVTADPGSRNPAHVTETTTDDPRRAELEPPPPMTAGVAEPPPTAAFASLEPAAGSDTSAAPRRAAAATQRLEREVAMIDAARRALAQGRAAEALTLLDRHRAEFSSGALHPESIILRVQALLAQGQRAAAEREAQPILTAAPGSRAADALRALLDDPPSP
ncbi:MAG: hypothetical protein JW751_26840 [Polyangiaceae bacterium]|nr:hypothetical protein [Polyangiaceae bacterium]